LVRRGCQTVSIAARKRKDLEAAAQVISSHCKQGQKVHYYELDVSTDYKTVTTGKLEKIIYRNVILDRSGSSKSCQ
jgi:NAD(P)-dependent dehydrogenase (short-subunit alcohol dehydrogenase family)